MKNADYNFKEPEVTFLSFFCTSSSVKPKDSSSMIIKEKGKQQIFTLKKLERGII